MGGFLFSASTAPAVADIAAFGLLRSRVALAAQLRLTLSHQSCFDTTDERLDGRKSVGFHLDHLVRYLARRRQSSIRLLAAYIEPSPSLDDNGG